MENEHKNHEEASEAAEPHVSHHKKKKNTNRIIAIVVVVIAVLLVGALAWLYTGELTSAKEKVFKAIPLPGAIVDKNFVSAESIIERINLSKELLEAQGLGDKANSAETFNQMVEVKKIEAIAENKGANASNEEIDEEFNNIITEYFDGDADAFKKELDSTYKMSEDEFKAEVIKQQVLQYNLSLWYSQQKDLNEKAYKTAQELQDKLASGQSFDDLAANYTQDESLKDFAGTSKMTAFDDLLPEFRKELESAQVGDVKLIASRYGIHIMKILDLNNNGENGAKQIQVQQIFVQQDGFEDWIKQQIESVNVVQLLKFA